MKSKKTLFLLVLVMLFLVLAACGKPPECDAACRDAVQADVTERHSGDGIPVADPEVQAAVRASFEGTPVAPGVAGGE